MIAAEATATIHRPVDEVFAYIAEPRNAPRWDGSVIEARADSPGPLRRGSVVDVVVRSFGRHSVRFEVVEFEIGRRIRMRAVAASIPFLPEVTYLFGPADGSTVFTRRVEIRPRGLLRALGPILARSVRTGNAGHVTAIKSVLEASARG